MRLLDAAGVSLAIGWVFCIAMWGFNAAAMFGPWLVCTILTFVFFSAAGIMIYMDVRRDHRH